MPRQAAPRSQYATRDAAAAAGSAHFYTGVPCKRNHVCNRYTINGACVECLHRKLPKVFQNRRPLMVTFPLYKLDDGKLIPKPSETGRAEYVENEPPSDEFLAWLEAYVNAHLDTYQRLYAEHLAAQLVATPKCEGRTLEAFRAIGWTDVQLLAEGYAAKAGQ